MGRLFAEQVRGSSDVWLVYQEPSGSGMVLMVAERQRVHDLLTRAIDKLSKRERDYITLVYYERWTSEQIASALDPGSVLAVAEIERDAITQLKGLLSELT